LWSFQTTLRLDRGAFGIVFAVKYCVHLPQASALAVPGTDAMRHSLPLLSKSESVPHLSFANREILL
jgi:hypothetical protein